MQDVALATLTSALCRRLVAVTVVIGRAVPQVQVGGRVTVRRCGASLTGCCSQERTAVCRVFLRISPVGTVLSTTLTEALSTDASVCLLLLAVRILAFGEGTSTDGERQTRAAGTKSQAVANRVTVFTALLKGFSP